VGTHILALICWHYALADDAEPLVVAAGAVVMASPAYSYLPPLCMCLPTPPLAPRSSLLLPSHNIACLLDAMYPV
jgi:hypothetical protein